jgi:FkbM family methyltransferase
VATRVGSAGLGSESVDTGERVYEGQIPPRPAYDARVLSPHELRRVEQTVACTDTDAIPKVPDAGSVAVRDGTRVQVMHNGVLVEADGYYGAWMTEIIRRLHGHHEPQEELVYQAAIERLAADTPAPVVLELGSFWGYYSLWAQRAIPRATCLLVEPDPANLDVGRRNFALNGATGRFLQAAMGSPHGAVEPFACESDGVTRDVERVTVDGLLKREGIERVDLLLCDVQGAELNMIEGAAQALAAGRIRFLFVSTHHHSISGDPLIHRRCLELLRWRGAHVISEHTARESCSGDGLIAASLDPRDADMDVAVSHVRAADSLFGDADDELAAALARIAELEREASPARVRPRFLRRGS